MRRTAIAAGVGLVVGIVLTLIVVVWYELRQFQRRVYAFSARSSEVQAGDTEASVRARFGRPQDIIDAKAEPNELAQLCRDKSVVRQLTYELTSCAVLRTEPPKLLPFVCLTEEGR